MKMRSLVNLLVFLGFSATAAAEAPAIRSPAPAAAVGTVLPVAPSVAPGGVSAWPDDRLPEARIRWSQGDAAGVVTILEPWLAQRRGGPRGRWRTSAHLLAGMAQMKLGNHNLASAHFYRVRRTRGPLAPYGAWYEALVDHQRGRHYVAARECKAYRESWPDGIHADECLLLMGDAYAAAGNRAASWAQYNRYLELNPDTPREEEIKLARVQATAVSNPKAAVQMAHDLWLNHSYPSTGLAVEALLEGLSETGLETAPPDDIAALKQRSTSLRRSGRFEDAWEMFQEIAKSAEADPNVAQWVSANEDRFAWSTRNYGRYAENRLADYENRPSADLAWTIYRTYARQGAWDKAAEWGRQSLENHGGHWRWRSAKDEIAHAEMLSGDYVAAHERFSGLRGADAAFYAAFTAYKAGELDKAEALFEPVIQRRSPWQAAGHYWRGMTRRAIGDEAGAAEDLQMAIETDRSGWYLLLQQEQPEEAEAWTRRDGRWHGDPPRHLPALQRPAAAAPPPVDIWPDQSPIVHHEGKQRRGLFAPSEKAHDWSALAWAPGRSPALDIEPLAQPDETVPAPATVGSLPTGYTACVWFDPDEAMDRLYRLARQHGDANAPLWAAYDLAQAGLYGEAARLIGPLYEQWKRQGVSNRLSTAEWREIFLAVQAHHYASRFCAGMGRGAPDEAARRAALRLAYPVVRPPEVWAHSQRFGIDPFLLMGIMRQESTYQEFVVSHAGAIGLVQVMPRTGARVAALMGEHRYSPGDLEDPSINIRYGAFYLSRLMDRFGGVYPLAVASYNGGPHNVSRWMRQLQGKVTLAEYVEMIPWDETRDYVKRVSGHYARYAYLYGPEGSALYLHDAPGEDDPGVIDF
ncbi:MAG: transglycosylase SLT domain-containing protein [Myxococcota bacterium]